MKNIHRRFGFITNAAVIALSFTACNKVNNARLAINAIQEMVENAKQVSDTGGGSAAASGGDWTWTRVTGSIFGSGEYDTIYSIAYGSGRFVAEGTNGNMAYADW